MCLRNKDDNYTHVHSDIHVPIYEYLFIDLTLNVINNKKLTFKIIKKTTNSQRCGISNCMT